MEEDYGTRLTRYILQATVKVVSGFIVISTLILIIAAIIK